MVEPIRLSELEGNAFEGADVLALGLVAGAFGYESGTLLASGEPAVVLELLVMPAGSDKLVILPLAFSKDLADTLNLDVSAFQISEEETDSEAE